MPVWHNSNDVAVACRTKFRHYGILQPKLLRKYSCQVPLDKSIWAWNFKNLKPKPILILRYEYHLQKNCEEEKRENIFCYCNAVKGAAARCRPTLQVVLDKTISAANFKNLKFKPTLTLENQKSPTYKKKYVTIRLPNNNLQSIAIRYICSCQVVLDKGIFWVQFKTLRRRKAIKPLLLLQGG